MQSPLGVSLFLLDDSLSATRREIDFSPIVYPSDMSKEILEIKGEALRATIPLGRIGNAKDMAGAILFLASRGGEYCNGMALLSDGGRLSIQPATY